MAIDITSELRQDAVSCFFEFLRRVRVDPDLLLCEDSHIERRKLEDAVGILLEADDIRREFDVSPLPIHEALGRSLKEAEELLEKMHNVATALRRLHEAEVVFAEYRMWLEEVQETLQHWEHYEENEIEKAIRYGARLERQQAQYETCAREISQIVEELHRSQYWASAEHEVEEKLRLVAAVEEDLFSDIAPGERRDRMDVDQGVACMRGILDELRELRTRLLGRSAKEKDAFESTLSWAREVLGVRVDATWDEVRKARRKLALLYHRDRDRSRGFEGDDERMKKINVAYELLEKAFKEATAYV
jgi:hypothetical protein